MGYVADESGAGVMKTRGRTRYLTSDSETRLLDGLPEGVKRRRSLCRRPIACHGQRR
jgi:hypothetical protein